MNKDETKLLIHFAEEAAISPRTTEGDSVRRIELLSLKTHNGTRHPRLTLWQIYRASSEVIILGSQQASLRQGTCCQHKEGNTYWHL